MPPSRPASGTSARGPSGAQTPTASTTPTARSPARPILGLTSTGADPTKTPGTATASASTRRATPRSWSRWRPSGGFARAAFQPRLATASPGFLYVPFHAVHTPVDAPDEFKRLYDGVRFDDAPAKHDSRLRLAAMISQLDASIGRLVTALDETGQRRDTLIVFTSDNGGIESLQNHYVGTVPDSPLNSENAPLRGEKNTLWEGGMRVCAFANWPGRLEPRKCTAVMHVADWFPTIARLVGWSPPQAPAWDGLDRWAAITGAPEAHSRPRPVCVVHPSGRAVIGDRWKLIVLDKRKNREESLQLYDLLADPFETTDQAAQEPAVVAEYLAIAEADAALDLTDMPADLRDAPP